MTKPNQSGFELLDDSFALLRELPARVWAGYLPGTLLLVWALLQLWMDATRTQSQERIVAGALAAAAAYAVKQIGECWLAKGLWEAASGGSVSLRWWSAALRQLAWQPWAVLMLPLGVVATMPFPLAVWFFRNLSINCARGLAKPVATAWEQAKAEPGQSWTFLAASSLAALMAYLNLLFTAVVLPQVVTSFTGFQSVWASPTVLLRTGALHAILLGIVYIAFDSLFTAAAVIRSFTDESRRTGGDIVAVLRRLSATAVLVAVLVVPTARGEVVDPDQLSQSIDRTLQRQEFSWRMPPQQASELPGWMKAVEGMLGKIRRAWNWLVDFMDRWLNAESKPRRDSNKGAAAPAGTLRLLLVAMAALSFGAVLYVLWRNRRAAKATEPLAAAPAKVDVRDEGVSAEQLPEDSWLQMARELEAAGEYRLALRAIHLAGLRRMSQAELVTIRRWKSGMDYIAELRRRGRGSSELNSLFKANWQAFDMGWYGHRPVEPSAVAEFRQKWEAIRGITSA